MKTTYNVIAISLTVCLAVGSLMFLAFLCGQNSRQKEIEDRFKTIENCNKVYTHKDIEMLLFGEQQL